MRLSVHSNAVGSNSVRFVSSLAKINLPRSLSLQSSESLAFHRKSIRVVRVENKHEGGQSLGRKSTQRINGSRTLAQIFLHVENARTDFLDRELVVVFSLFGPGN